MSSDKIKMDRPKVFTGHVLVEKFSNDALVLSVEKDNLAFDMSFISKWIMCRDMLLASGATTVFPGKIATQALGNAGVLGGHPVFALVNGVYLTDMDSDTSENELEYETGEIIGRANTFYTYSGDSAVKGSLNISESYIDVENHKIRYVFDFPTNAANGTFQSVMLVSGSGFAYYNPSVEGSNIEFPLAAVITPKFAPGFKTRSILPMFEAVAHIKTDYDNKRHVTLSGDCLRIYNMNVALGNTIFQKNLRNASGSMYTLGTTMCLKYKGKYLVFASAYDGIGSDWATYKKRMFRFDFDAADITNNDPVNAEAELHSSMPFPLNLEKYGGSYNSCIYSEADDIIILHLDSTVINTITGLPLKRHLFFMDILTGAITRTYVLNEVQNSPSLKLDYNSVDDVLTIAHVISKYSSESSLLIRRIKLNDDGNEYVLGDSKLVVNTQTEAKILPWFVNNELYAFPGYQYSDQLAANIKGDIYLWKVRTVGKTTRVLLPSPVTKMNTETLKVTYDVIIDPEIFGL